MTGETTMKYCLLGRSGLRVSELALGAMSFGREWGWGIEINEARRMLDVYFDNGGNFVDTANFYTGGSSEKMLGESLKEKRRQIVLSTARERFSTWESRIRRRGKSQGCKPSPIFVDGRRW
jgi:aryl-alcohol dehydrogenase-like predicted oxidoreductase